MIVHMLFFSIFPVVYAFLLSFHSLCFLLVSLLSFQQMLCACLLLWATFFWKSLFVPGREVANPCCLHHLTFSSAQRHANDPSASVLLRADLLISPNDMRSHSDDDGVCFCTLNIHCHEDKVLELASKSQIPCSYICATFHGTHYSRCEPSSARED